MKKLFALLLASLMLVSLVACGGEDSKEEVFTSNGMSITLDNSFKESSYEGYTVCFESKTVAIFGLKESFTLLAGLENYTLAQYAELVHNANSSKTPSAITTVDGLTTFEYTFLNTENNVTYKYFTTMFKGDDAFWTIQFSCDAKDYDANKADFIKYAKSIDVTKD